MVLRDRVVRLLFVLTLLIVISFPIITIFFIYPSFTNLLIKNTEEEAIRTATHLAELFTDHHSEVTKTSFNKVALQHIEKVKKDFKLMKIKLFSPKGEVVYSTDPEDIGKINKKDYFHKIVAKGRPFTNIVKKNTLSLEDQIVTADVVETYVPIMNGEKLLGAFELYYDITKRDQIMNRVLSHSSAITFATMFILISVIGFLLWRLDHGIKKVERTKRDLLLNKQQLAEYNRFLKEIIESIPHPFLVINVSDYSIKLANSVVKQFGDWENTTCYNLIHKRDTPCSEDNETCPVREVVRKKQPVIVEHIHHAKSGKKMIYEVHGYPVFDEHGEVVQMIEYSLDITKRKDAEEALIQSNEKILKQHLELEMKTQEIEESRSKLQLALDGIQSLLEDVITEKVFHIRFLNPNLAKCYELKNCTNTECPCYGKSPQRCWVIAGTYCGGKVQGSFAKKIKDCTECSVFKKATEDPFYKIGELFNNMMHILEIKNRELQEAYEELKQTQLQILQQEKMASIGQLAAGVAHEINNPMGFISSNLSTLSKYIERLIEYMNLLSNSTSPDQSEKLEEAKKRLKIDYIIEDIKDLINESLEGAERVKKIVQDLKTFSRVDEAEYKMADINECIESTLNIVWNELKYKATVTKEYGDIPLTKCYPQQLSQVFMNLLVNAAHAIEKQGEIKIKTWADDGWIYITVSDTGCGIPKENLSKIFEPFFTTKEVGKGTGLGLSIAYDIIKKHNGEISVDSEVGKGTTFTIKIPVVAGQM